MAIVPETAVVLQNPAGWAPCISVAHKASTFMMMPGPPREMKAVFETHIQPLIAERYRSEIITARVHVSMFEAEVSPLMQKVMERHPDVYLKAYVALRKVDGDTMPVDLVQQRTDEADCWNAASTSTDYSVNSLLRGKTF